MIIRDTDGGLIIANMEALVTSAFSSSRAFVNLIHYVIVSASAIYLASH
jgi:hypothetical protein